MNRKIEKLAAYLWDRDSGEVESWDELFAAEKQNVIEHYDLTHLVEALEAVGWTWQEGGAA